MQENIQIAIERKNDALNALPPRLAFICKISKEPQWEKDLSSTIKSSYYNLHHTASLTPSITSAALDISTNKYYDITKLRHKTKNEIELLQQERMSNIK